MSDQSKLGLGQLITTNQCRDAIHIAVAPLKCGDQKTWPGSHVGVSGEKFSEEIRPHVGIVDPFLERAVFEGQRAWIYLYPGSITSLRHSWSHPSFPDPIEPTPEPSKTKSEQWMRDLAESVGVTYRQLLSGAAAWVESKRSNAEWPEYLTGGAEMEGECVPSGFWEHYRNITGDAVSEEHQGSFFSCSC